MFCQYPCAIDRARGGDSAKTLTRLCCAADHNPRDPHNCRCNMMQHVQKRPSAQSTSFRRPILKSFYLVHTTRAATPSDCNAARAGSPDSGNLTLLRLFGLQQPVVPARVHTLHRSPTLRCVTFEWCKHCRHCRQKHRLHQTDQQSKLPGCLRVVRTGLLSFGSRKFMSLGWSLLLRFRACFLSMHLSPFFRFHGTLKVRVAHGFKDIHMTDRDCSRFCFADATADRA